MNAPPKTTVHDTKQTHKIALAVPVYNDGSILPEFLNALLKLDPQPDLHLFAENNSSDNTLDLISDFPKPKKIIRLWFKEDANQILGSPYASIAIMRGMLLTEARNLDVDYMIFLDTDIIPDPLLISKFLVHYHMRKDVDIIGGPYWCIHPVTFIGQKKHEYKLVICAFFDVKNGTYIKIISSDLKPHFPLLWILRKADIVGTGCMCFPKRVIQDRRLTFFPLLDESSLKGIGEASEDASFCLRARKLGYNIHLDGTIKLDHKFGTIQPDGTFQIRKRRSWSNKT